MSITLTINSQEYTLEYYAGWSEPGRTPELSLQRQSDLPLQLIRLETALKYFIANDKTFHQEELRDLANISPSAWRQIRPLLFKLGMLNGHISQSKPIEVDEPFSIKGRAFNAITRKRLLNEYNFHALKSIHEMLWCDLFMYYTTDNPAGLFPVRAILRALCRNDYLSHTDWNILTTFIEENDSLEQEAIADAFITEYRQNPLLFENIQRIPDNLESTRRSVQNCRNTYWSNLQQAGIIEKKRLDINGQEQEVILIGNKYPDLVKTILSEDFFEAIEEVTEDEL
ncbi:hypothetical protein MPH47_07330 [Psychrobacillus psychrodurans]|uniref:hypothetical protein n=1 Tax=Psychrobacillus psychrodurans TaxID=126157 RepID=UPI001F4E0923|nr:hypothetical protein [Psychrobacillus psychrodurans]MCK1997036.1 hypothetical protein [Psychrobacillus psychrodurans]